MREAAVDDASSREDAAGSKLAAIAARERELSRALIDANDQLLRRDREIRDLQEAVAHTLRQQEEIQRLEELNRQVHAELAEMAGSRPMRLHRRLVTLPGVRWLRQHRRAS